jgi:hypothetical protein
MKAREKLGKTVTARNAPKVTGDAVGSVQPYSEVEYTAIVGDLQYPNDPRYQWLKLADGYVNYFYPPAGQRFELIQPTPPGPTRTHVIEVYSDGSIVIDGIPYQ